MGTINDFTGDNINLHACELGIVSAVHTLVAEVLGELVDAFEAAHDEALEVKFVGDAQVEGDVERVVVGYEGACRSSAGDALQNGGFHLHVAVFVEVVAHGVEQIGRAHV